MIRSITVQKRLARESAMVFSYEIKKAVFSLNKHYKLEKPFFRNYRTIGHFGVALFIPSPLRIILRSKIPQIRFNFLVRSLSSNHWRFSFLHEMFQWKTVLINT